jgi:hypothetical protein
MVRPGSRIIAPTYLQITLHLPPALQPEPDHPPSLLAVRLALRLFLALCLNSLITQSFQRIHILQSLAVIHRDTEIIHGLLDVLVHVFVV